MRSFTTLIILLYSMAGVSQSVNDYQYVIVPSKYDFLKSADQYELNSLTKFLFNKYGFTAFLEGDDKPFNLKDNICKVLYADVEDDSNFIKARVNVVLRDCEDNIVFKSSQGQNKSKDYKTGYHLALREAFEDVVALDYEFAGTPLEIAETTSTIVKEPGGTVVVETEPVETLIVETAPVETTAIGTSIKDKPVSEAKAPKIIKKEELDAYAAKAIITPTLYTTVDGSYKAVKFGDSITFYEGDKTIGNVAVLEKSSFTVTTSQFEGSAMITGDNLIVERKIKGVAGTVQMIFTRQ